MKLFSAEIKKIGINPYVLVPKDLLELLFKKAGKKKGAIPVRLKISGQVFEQNLVKYRGLWRLYLNTPMRKKAKKDVGDAINIYIDYDAQERKTPMHPQFETALNENLAAKLKFEKLVPSRRKELLRYLNNLKTEESRNRNIAKVMAELSQ